MIVLILFMLMQMPDPRDMTSSFIGPAPGHFRLCQKPWGLAHISVQKPRGAPAGGMVAGQIDTCITLSPFCRTRGVLVWECAITISTRLGIEVILLLTRSYLVCLCIRMFSGFNFPRLMCTDFVTSPVHKHVF